MKILYYDCFAGISGDMNLGALIDIGVDPNYLIEELKKLPMSNEFEIKIEKKQKMGITGTKVDVILYNETTHTHVHEGEGHSHVHEGEGHSHVHEGEGHTHVHEDEGHSHHHEDGGHAHHHEHRNLKSIYKIIENTPYSNKVKQLSKEIFLNVALAEAKVHGKSVDEVHFHEVGATDSIVDIVGAAICFDALNVDKVMASTIELGGGFVKCAHGLMPVPAPATSEILKGVPTHIGKVPFETTTPTGAAIIKTLVDEFTDDLDFKINKTGYGLGTKDFSIPNLVRVYLAETNETENEKQVMIEVNIDDMNSELYSNIEELLFENGALDVYKTPIIMKKGRPAILLSVLTELKNEKKIEKILFTETTTLGLRKYQVDKVMLNRSFETINTKYGEVIIKKGVLDGKVIKWKPEYEVCKKIAKEYGISIQEVYKEIYKNIED